MRFLQSTTGLALTSAAGGVAVALLQIWITR
jgi:hypothetical protein